MKVYRVTVGALILAAALVWAVAAWAWMARAMHGPAARQGEGADSGQFPAGIVIHHTATPPVVGGRKVDVAFIDRTHAARGFRPVTGPDGRVYHVGYHYLIQQDGTVLKARPESLRGQHTRGRPEMLGISLIGDFESTSNRRGAHGPLRPPRAQLEAAIRLTKELMGRYDLPTSRVYLHRELTSTDCPGDRFPARDFRAALAR